MQKNYLEHVKVAKLRFVVTKFGQNHAFLSIFPQFSPKFFILTPHRSIRLYTNFDFSGLEWIMAATGNQLSED